MTGQVPPGHTVRNDGTHGAASPILRPRFVGRHPIQRFSLDGGSASAVAVDPYLGRARLRRTCGSSPVSSPGGTKVLLELQWKPSPNCPTDSRPVTALEQQLQEKLQEEE